MNIEARLSRWEASEEIRNLKSYYCQVCDDGYDVPKLLAMFTDDGAWDGGKLGVAEGQAALEKFFTQMPSVLSMAFHYITNPHIVVAEDCQSASGIWNILEAGTSVETGSGIWLAARYHDEFVKVGDKWLFKRITVKTKFLAPYESGWVKRPAAA